MVRIQPPEQPTFPEQSEFIDFVAHELKQPMTAILGYTKMLLMGIGGELGDNQRQFVEVIDSNATRMGRLVNDLLEFSRLEAGRVHLHVAPVHLEGILEETVAQARSEIEARQHTVEVEFPEGLPPVWGDRERLLQILSHLVSNACMYTPNGGTLRIAVQEGARSEGRQAHLRVSVSDTGIGMSSKELAQLGQPFYRADHDLVHEQWGTGLGLSIARHLIALHGGELLVESGVDKGSTFRFSVPLANEGKG
ncbi:MAG: HAMP domain-containing sensor histidine kinase [Anaerolineae bacterium]